jgi:hypothetical protein
LPQSCPLALALSSARKAVTKGSGCEMRVIEVTNIGLFFALLSINCQHSGMFQSGQPWGRKLYLSGYSMARLAKQRATKTNVDVNSAARLAEFTSSKLMALQKSPSHYQRNTEYRVRRQRIYRKQKQSANALTYCVARFI